MQTKFERWFILNNDHLLTTFGLDVSLRSGSRDEFREGRTEPCVKEWSRVEYREV